MSRIEGTETSQQGMKEAAEEKTHEMGQAAKEYYEQGRQKATEYYEQGREKAREWTQGIEGYIREKPVTSVMIAAGVGMVLGFIWRRS